MPLREYRAHDATPADDLRMGVGEGQHEAHLEGGVDLQGLVGPEEHAGPADVLDPAHEPLGRFDRAVAQRKVEREPRRASGVVLHVMNVICMKCALP